MTDTPQHDAEATNELSSQVQHLAKIERERATKAQQRTQLWTKLENAIESSASPMQLLVYVRELKQAEVETDEAFKGVQTQVEQQCRDYFLTYGDRFRQACAQVHLSAEGRFPSFLVNGVLHVEIDEERLRATIGSRTLVGDVAVEQVAKLTAEEAKRLLDREFDAGAFVTGLFRAYRHALVEQEKEGRIGDDLPLPAVHRFMVLLSQPDRLVRGAASERFVSYPPDEFAVDLGKLLTVGNPPTSDGYRAHLGFVRQAGSKGYFVFNPATKTGQRYGLVAFRK